MPDTSTWPGIVQLTSDNDQGFSDISSSLPSLGTTNLNSVWSPCAEEVWTVGAGGNIWHKSGGSWAQDTGHPFGGTQLWSVWGPDCDTVFVCGGAGKIAKWTSGGGWGSLQTTPISDTIRGIQGINDQILWTCGNSGKVLLTTDGGSNWSSISNPFSGVSYGLNVVSDQEVFICGVLGQIIHSTNQGTDWTIQTTPNVTRCNWMWSSPSRDSGGLANEVWCAQNSGKILFYDGVSWVEQVTGLGGGVEDVNGIIGSNAASIFAVGGNGDLLIWFYDGVAWTEIKNITGNEATAVAWFPGTRPFVSGQNGQMFESDAVFVDDEEIDVKISLPQQPEQAATVTITVEEGGDASLTGEAFGSNTGMFEGEEMFLGPFGTGDMPEAFRHYLARLKMEASTNNDISPTLDRLQMTFGA